MKHKIYISIVSGLLLLTGISMQLYAEPGQRHVQGVSYSYDHWPHRWSSAIHQQQDARFPNRQQSKQSAQRMEESISERDLFYLPSSDRRYGFASRGSHADGRLPRNRYLREMRRSPRESAYAYHPMQPMYFSGHFGSVYGGVGMNSAVGGFDPVMGMPGNGMPFMPAAPYGYPALGFQGGGYFGTPYPNW